MDCVVLIPGILGSILNTPDGKEVWPPKPREVIFGYKRIDQIMRDDVVSTDIVRSVSCFPVYQPLIRQLKDLGFHEGDNTKRLDIFHYDWRQDLEIVAGLLSDRLEALVADGATAITIVAHSMGGLVTRLTLEPATYRGTSWYPLIRGAFTLGTPHLGAPMALVRILGLDGELGVSGKDFKKFASDPRFPSAYQLLPAPGESAVWDAQDPTIGALNIYDAAQATRIGLDPALVARTAWVHTTLAAGKKPDHTRYFFFGGGGHTTCTRLNVAPNFAQPTMTADGGDGTVPMWSAFGRATQKQLVTGEHAKFYRRDQFQAVFYRLFGQKYKIPPTKAADAVTLSVQAIALKPDEPVEVLILSPEPVSVIKGQLSLAFTDDENTPFETVGAPVPVTYEGPPLRQLRVELPATNRPGHYQLSFTGEPAADEPVLFSVKAADE